MALAPQESAARFLPARRSKRALTDAAAGCTACPLYERATQTVFGEGPVPAGLLLVGEQPGDQEDRLGAPFVGPAGRVLDRALGELGLDRSKVWLTNAVKHIKWEPRGKRRLHQKPDVAEIEVCNPWLLAEVELVDPGCIVALGATAVRGVLGRNLPIKKNRAQVLESRSGRKVVITYHPSAILRAPEHDDREALFRLLVEDLAVAQEVAGRPVSAGRRARRGR